MMNDANNYDFILTKQLVLEIGITCRKKAYLLTALMLHSRHDMSVITPRFWTIWEREMLAPVTNKG